MPAQQQEPSAGGTSVIAETLATTETPSSSKDASTTVYRPFSRRDCNSRDISSVGTLAIAETPSSSKYASTTAGTFSRTSVIAGTLAASDH
jgi:hypothetical protein